MNLRNFEFEFIGWWYLERFDLYYIKLGIFCRSFGGREVVRVVVVVYVNAEMIKIIVLIWVFRVYWIFIFYRLIILGEGVINSIRNFRIIEVYGNRNGYRKIFVVEVDKLRRLKRECYYYFCLILCLYIFGFYRLVF